MDPEQTIIELEQYRMKFSEIMERFDSNFNIKRDDDPVYRTLVIEIVDLLNDVIGENNYSKLITNSFNQGTFNEFRSPSYKSIEDIVSVIGSAITWIRRNSENLTKREDTIIKTETIKTMLEPPEKVTLKWLWDHVPYQFWGVLIGLLISVFTLGVTFANTEMYKSAINLLTPNNNANTKMPITKQ